MMSRRRSRQRDSRVNSLRLCESDYPALFQAADRYALQQQRLYFMLLAAQLISLLVVSVASLIPSPRVGGFVQLLCLLLAVVFSAVIQLAQPNRQWYASRALAESVKTITWRFAIRGEPFNVDDRTARALLSERLRSLLEQNREVAQRFNRFLDGDYVTTKMQMIRGESFDSRKNWYHEGRIKDQKSWYAAKATHNSNRAKCSFVAIVALLILGVCISVARTALEWEISWPTEIAITATAAVLTWVQAKRFSELAAAYSLAALEIGSIEVRLNDVHTDTDLSAFVGDAESAFSREHTQWAARRDA